MEVFMKLWTSLFSFLQCDFIDYSWLDINLKASFQEERYIIEGKTKNKDSKLVFHQRSIIDVAGP